MKRTPLARKTGIKAKAKKHQSGARAYMARVAALPCVICGARPVHVHHVIHDRYSAKKSPDTDTIPLCPRCHDSLHAGKQSWRESHGPDWSYIPIVRAALGLP